MAAAAVTRRRKSTDGGGIAALPDELLLEVFSRVGNVKALFLFAVTSRRWLRLFTDPAFLRELCPGHGEGRRARLLGFVPRQAKLHRALTSFVANDDGTFNYAQPLAARHGILLRHIVVNRGSCCIRRKPDIHCRLLDPVTGAHDDVAPPLECACVNHANGYAILTAADGDHINREQRPPSSAPHPAFSGELLLVGSHLDNNRLRQHVHSFSGATRRWSAPAQIRHHNRLRMVGARAAVVPRGAAHWLRRDLYLLSASTATGRASASVTKLAIKAAGGVPYLCVRRDGRFSLARVHPTRVDVWTQPDGDDGGDMVAWLRAQFYGKEWLLSQVIQMPAAAVPAGANFMCCSWFQFSKGAMMAVYGGSGVFVLNLETKAIEKIMDLTWCDPSRGYYSCLPYEMDPPEFFVGRLGGRAMETEEQAGLTMRD
uniref:F-box domain-containing protein n=1 Tax=Setaria italica TaxID=4555 RepID=K3XQ88_SETIT